MTPLLAALLLFGWPGLSAAELDQFPDSWLLWKWKGCCEEFMFAQDAGPVRDECGRIRDGLDRLSYAKYFRDERQDDFRAREAFAEALACCPEWRFAPSRVLFLPYAMLKK